MKKNKYEIQLSATDISNYLSCHHLTELDLKVLNGELPKPDFNNPHAQVLQERGFEHETKYLEHLKNLFGEVVVIPEDGSPSDLYQQTKDAIQSGARVIAQAVLMHEDWFGRADFIVRTKDGQLEIRDTKLSRETKASAILQLCLYGEMLKQITEKMPEYMQVVSPGAPFIEKLYRINDYFAYYSMVKTNFIKALKENKPYYPEPVMHCDVCKWFDRCDKRRRDDDHLSFVAGLTTDYRKAFESNDVKTLKSLATNLPTIPELKNNEVVERLHHQARLQLEARESGKPKFELLEVQEGRGFYRLPTPTEGDIFFDLEGDQFFQESGLEYLWGFSSIENGNLSYHHKWAKNYKEEKECFEWFIGEVLKRKETYPHLKIYHYSPYEPGALKRLMGRYGILENEIDHLLRTESFVDLYSIVRQSLRAGIEKYSIKDLEQFYNFERKAKLRELGPAKRAVEHALELNSFQELSEETLEMVRAYNQDDTDSTFFLREWLEELRPNIERPIEKDGEIQEELNEELKRLNAIRDKLQEEISPIPEERTREQQSRWLLGDLVGFYRREDKVNFWEKFRLKSLDALELIDEKSGISGLKIQETVGGTEKCPIHRYCFVDQYVDIKTGTTVFKEGALPDQKEEIFGTIHHIDIENRYVDIKKSAKEKDYHPNALWAWSHIPKKNKVDRMLEFAEDVINEGTKYQAAKDILFRKSPNLKSEISESETNLIKRTQDFALALDHSYLAIQGPPGTGKSYTASRLIVRLLKEGYKVGVTGLSHKVISNLMAKTAEACEKEGVKFPLHQKTDKENQDHAGVECISKTDKVLKHEEPYVLGATDFEWSKSECSDAVDYLVVDEAGQFSLVGILSIAHATKNIVLLGDPAQLQQPIQGSHPDGCEVSCLEYIMDDEKTLLKEKGVFLETTYRLHPDICTFNSELFYESKLFAIKENEYQVISGPTQFAGQALAYVPCEHHGNTNFSKEEIDAVIAIVNELVNSENFYTVYKDGKAITDRITPDSIKIISPYNAQVSKLKFELPDIQIGTVDKFQGQEAPIVIYSVATSSPEDAPRGMEFLYSPNRLNVAVSRAECLFIMVASTRIFEPNCKTPVQMKLANSFCKFNEKVVV